MPYLTGTVGVFMQLHSSIKQPPTACNLIWPPVPTCNCALCWARVTSSSLSNVSALTIAWRTRSSTLARTCVCVSCVCLCMAVTMAWHTCSSALARHLEPQRHSARMHNYRTVIVLLLCSCSSLFCTQFLWLLFSALCMTAGYTAGSTRITTIITPTSSNHGPRCFSAASLSCPLSWLAAARSASAFFKFIRNTKLSAVSLATA